MKRIKYLSLLLALTLLAGLLAGCGGSGRLRPGGGGSRRGSPGRD